MPFLPQFPSDGLSSPGTTLSHSSPMVGSAPQGLPSPTGPQQQVQLLGDHRVPLVPNNGLSSQRPPCPAGAVFPLPGGNHQAIVFQAPPHTGTRFIPAPELMHTQAPAASMTHTASPRNLEAGRKEHGKHVLRAAGGTEPAQLGCDSPMAGLTAGKPGAWHLTKPPGFLFK